MNFDRDVQLIRGDSLEVLKKVPTESVDVCVTSPPYNKMERGGGTIVPAVRYDTASDSRKERDYQLEQIAVLNELHRVSKAGGSCFYNHRVRHWAGTMEHPLDWLRGTHWRIRQELIWNRRFTGDVSGYRFYEFTEKIFWLYKPIGEEVGKKLKGNHAAMSSVWEFPPEFKNPHPAPFPLVLPLRAIYSVMDEDIGVVIDPYCGSGTTGVAARLMGHKFLGVDVSAEYLDFADTRIGNYKTERAVWDAERSAHFSKHSRVNSNRYHRTLWKTKRILGD